MRWSLLVTFILVCFETGLFAQQQQPRLGILGQPAPAWTIPVWNNLPAKTTSLNVTDFQGKVLYLYCFQSWCPGCHRYGFPTLQKLVKHYQKNPDVAFIAVQTVFEGYSTNTAARARKTMKQYKLTIPVGHVGRAGSPNPLMRDYRTGGTPWAIIIDPQGVVRYNDFHITPQAAIALIDDLSKSDPNQIVTLPASRGGQDLIGQKMPPLKFDRWINPPEKSIQKPKATLYRWWTDSCPYCVASLPAVEILRSNFSGGIFWPIKSWPPRLAGKVTI